MPPFWEIFAVTAIAGRDGAARLGQALLALFVLLFAIAALAAGVSDLVNHLDGKSALQAQALRMDSAEKTACYQQQAAGQAPGADCSLVGNPDEPQQINGQWVTP